MSDRVPNDLLREAYLRARNTGVTPTDVARACGWVRPRKRYRHDQADVSRVKRMLGLVANEGYFHKTVAYDDAVRITLALGLDPVDLGV